MINKALITTLAIAGFAVAAHATAVPFTFLENGSNVALGTSSTFTESGVTLTAYGFNGTGGTATLFAKDDGAGSGEQGLGITSDPTGENEIWGTTFVQIVAGAGLPTVQVSFGSTTDGEAANIYYSTTLGTLGTLIGSVTSDTTFAIASAYQNGYIGIQAGGNNGGTPNVLLGGATLNTPSAPDGGTTVAMLGGVLAALGMARRKMTV